MDLLHYLKDNHNKKRRPNWSSFYLRNILNFDNKVDVKKVKGCKFAESVKVVVIKNVVVKPTNVAPVSVNLTGAKIE